MFLAIHERNNKITSLIATYFGTVDIFRSDDNAEICTWCVQVLRSPKEAFAAAMQSWRERCEKVYVYRVITLRNDCIFSFLW